MTVRVTDQGRGIAQAGAGARVRAVLPGPRRSRSRLRARPGDLARASSRQTAAGSCCRPGAADGTSFAVSFPVAPASRASAVERAATSALSDGAPGARRRRRAADRARPEGVLRSAGYARRGGRDQGARRSTPLATRPAGRAGARPGAARRQRRRRLPRGAAAGASCRSSCSRRSATNARRCARSTPAPTTTSPSRSAPTSCWPGCARCCAASADDAGRAELHVGDLVIDLADRRVTRPASEVHLTPIEFDLLRVLAAAPGPAASPSASCCGRCGDRSTGRDPLPARPRRAHPREARARPVAPALPDHRAGRRLPAARACVARPRLAKSLRPRPDLLAGS